MEVDFLGKSVVFPRAAVLGKCRIRVWQLQLILSKLDKSRQDHCLETAKTPIAGEKECF
jgi:hypothetical protein